VINNSITRIAKKLQNSPNGANLAQDGPDIPGVTAIPKNNQRNANVKCAIFLYVEPKINARFLRYALFNNDQQ